MNLKELYTEIASEPPNPPGKLSQLAQGVSGWRVDHVRDLLRQPSPTQWVVQGLVERNTLAAWIGAPGSAKSLAMQDMGCSIATGTPWHGHQTTQGAVVYMAGEGHSGSPKRFMAWSIEHGRELTDAPLFVSSAAIDLAGNAGHIVRVISEASTEPPALVIIDTLHRHLAAGADENSSTDMAGMIGGADTIRQAFGCAVILVHHTGHAATDRERGSSSLRGAMDWAYLVQKGDGGPVTITCKKAKDHEPPGDLHFKLHTVELPWFDDDDMPETSAVLRSTDHTDTRMGSNQQQAMSSLRRLPQAAGGDLVTIQDWRKDAGIDRRRWREVLSSLTEQGLVIVEGDHVRLTEPDLDRPSEVPP